VAALLPAALTDTQKNVVYSDFLVIQWWADAMRAMAEKIVAVRTFFASHSGAPDPNSNEFRKLRKEFRKKITAVARTTKKQFGDPWGLVAMDLVAGRKARAKVKLTGDAIALEKSRPKAAGAGA
jgi:hypothetical protein